MRSVHFISGLPRSGSTLLSAILRQNPRFHADITGPMAALCGSLHHQIGGAGEFSMLFDEARCARMLRALFDAYYSHVPEDSIVFDTNRTWTARAPLIGELYPEAKIICCVRSVGWIIDSIERLRIKNPLKLSKLFTPQQSESLYARVDALMNSEHGLVGSAWSMLREAWFSQTAGRLVVLPYDVLVTEPERTMRRLYRALGEPYFNHDFRNVAYDAPAYDTHLRAPGLHSVHKVVEQRAREPVIPPDIFARYAPTHFWDSPELNPRGVVIIQ